MVRLYKSVVLNDPTAPVQQDRNDRDDTKSAHRGFSLFYRIPLCFISRVYVYTIVGQLFNYTE